MKDEDEDPIGGMSDAEYLLDLAERLACVPAMYSVDQGDVDRLEAVAVNVQTTRAALLAIRRLSSKDGTLRLGKALDAINEAASSACSALGEE